MAGTSLALGSGREAATVISAEDKHWEAAKVSNRIAEARKRFSLVSTIALVLLGMTAARTEATEQLCDSSFQDCRTPLLNLIKAETTEIDVGLWFMEDARYSALLVQKQQAGVIVRVLMDPRVFPQDPADKQIMDQLQAAGIPMRKRIASGIEHWKAMIFAHQNTVYFGSANFSSNAFVFVQPYVNYVDETVYITNDASVVNSFMTKFDDAWVDTTSYAGYANSAGILTRHYPTMPIDPELNFPPGQDYATRSVSRYNAETQQIDAMMFRITDQRHTDAIIAAKSRGVPIRLIVDPGEYRNRARIWDAWNVDRLYTAGVSIRNTTHQGENHGKLVMLHGQGLTIFGSSNWSSPSANSQHEHNYFTTKPNIFDWFVTYFNRRWNNSNPAGARETGPFTPLAPGTPTYQTPANGASSIPTTGTSLVWDGGAWAHNYDIYFGTSSPPPLYLANRNLGPDDPAKSPKQYQRVALPTLSSGTTYFWQIRSKTMANVAKTGPIWSFTAGGVASGLPSPWKQTDIGTVPVAGSAQYANGAFTITGSGADIWGAADAFHFVYRQLTGDFTIQARVASVREASTWSKAGVMIRETLNSNSKHAFALASAAKGVALQWRPATGAASQNVSGSSSAPPRWVRLQRSGTTFTASESANGSAWTAIGHASIAMSSSVFAGFAVTSHTSSSTTTAVIDNTTS
jgi:phosphatidylserine/phosphatidylglycerophosphate/cardiolipin synthase-like enzyme/regulation of enolase protein 1 (concanavalin A-like superfamily)